jgi:pyruvyl transferase EpsI
MLPFWLKLIIIRILVVTQYIFYWLFPKQLKDLNAEDKKIFVLLSTDYSNLGDHAMTYAHLKLLNDNFPEYEVVEITVCDTLKCFKTLVKEIKAGDVITLKGGGNIGLEYFREELIRRKIVSTFLANKIILFPQTVYFPNSKLGMNEFKNTIDIFNKHKELYAFFRDQNSYELMNKYLNRNTYFLPDIVYYLGNIPIKEKRDGITVCMRRDVEGIYSDDIKIKLVETLKSYGNVLVTDTIKDYYISIEDRENELRDIWKTIASSEVVITDRLHGMIFATLLDVPCIVLKTYNYKLTGQYQWLKNVNFIEQIDFDINKIIQTVDKLKSIEHSGFDSYKMKSYFNQLIKCIRE